MKKFLIAIVIVLFHAGNVLALGTVTQSDVAIYDNVRVLTFTCTADVTAHTYPVTTSSGNINGYIFLVVTNPGGVAPTTLYDITLTDSDGVDIMGGELANRSATLSEQAVPLMGNVYGSRFVNGTLTITITNNSVNSAVTVVKIFYYR